MGSSEKCVLLRLKRSNFLKLMKTDIFNKKSEDSDDKSIMEQMKETRMERSKSNRMMMHGRNNDGDDELVDKNQKIKEEEKKTEVSKVMVVPMVKNKETKKSVV